MVLFYWFSPLLLVLDRDRSLLVCIVSNKLQIILGSISFSILSFEILFKKNHFKYLTLIGLMIITFSTCDFFSSSCPENHLTAHQIDPVTDCSQLPGRVPLAVGCVHFANQYNVLFIIFTVSDLQSKVQTLIVKNQPDKEKWICL